MSMSDNQGKGPTFDAQKRTNTTQKVGEVVANVATCPAQQIFFLWTFCSTFYGSYLKSLTTHNQKINP